MRATTAANLLMFVVLTACAAGGGPLPTPRPDPSVPTATPSMSPSASPSPSPSPSAPASVMPSAEPSPDGGSGEVIVTFQTAGNEQFRILLTAAKNIRTAEQLLSGELTGPFPNGLVVRGDDGGVNSGWSWHIDPESLQFAEMTTEVCDGRPSDVEAGTITSDYFCPWTAVVVAIEPAG